MPKTHRLKAGQFQYKTIILQFSEYFYKFQSYKPVDTSTARLLFSTNNPVQKCFLQTLCTYQSPVGAQHLTRRAYHTRSGGRGAVAWGSC